MKSLYFTLILSLFFFHHTNCQIVSTILDSNNVNISDAVIMDAGGNIFGADYGGSDVYKITPEGNVSVFVTGLNTPNGLAFDGQGNLYVCDNLGGAIYKYNSDGNPLDTFPISYSSGIIKDFDSDTMIFTRTGAHSINKLAPDGTIDTIFTGSPLNAPVGIAYSESGELFIGNFSDRNIFKLIADSISYVATVPGPTSSSYLGFIAYGGGAIWGTSWHYASIYKIYPSFIDSTELYAGTLAGYKDGHVDSARFSQVNGIWATPSGDSILVTEYASGRLRLISSEPEDTIPTGISKSPIERIDLQIFPNPNSDILHIIIPENLGSVELSIFNLNGQLIEAQIINSASPQRIDLTNFESGLYILKVSKNNRIVESRKLIIEK